MEKMVVALEIRSVAGRDGIMMGVVWGEMESGWG